MEELKPAILLGAGGHARVVYELARLIGYEVIGMCAPELPDESDNFWNGMKYFGPDNSLDFLDSSDYFLLNGIGQMPFNSTRRFVYDKFTARGFYFPALIHPFSFVSPSATVLDGAQVFAGAILQANVKVGSNVIINTRVSVDHDSVISDNVHLAPGSIVCGGVCIEAGVFVGAGAVVANGVHVGLNSVIGAGASCVKDMPQASKLVPLNKRALL
ncbi:MAG: acetyltransferase [Candidatus Planktophila sp.]